MKKLIALAAALLTVGCHSLVLDEKLYLATPLTATNSFTAGIEGPACDRAGNIFAVNFAQQQTIGRTTPAGQSEVFVTLPNDSVGNGIRFDRAGRMYVADYVGHNILRIDLTTRAVTVLAHEPMMNQPNDLAIAPNGTLYASDPNWKAKAGQLWRIDPDGTTARLAADMGTTNGVEVSPDGKRLYVNESVQRNVWVFDIQPDGGWPTSGCCGSFLITVLTACAVMRTATCTSHAMAKAPWPCCRRKVKYCGRLMCWARAQVISASAGRMAGRCMSPK